MSTMIGDRPSVDPGLDEPEYSTVFCECGEKKEIPVEFYHRQFRACNEKDLVCAKCGAVMEF